MKLARNIVGWKHSREAVVVVVAFVLYVLGIKFLLLPVLIWLNARYVPMPRIFGSWFSRLFGGFLLAAVALQIAATVQFLIMPVIPVSSFQAIAALLVALHIILWKFVPVQAPVTSKKLRFFDARDAAALIVVAIFLLPFIPSLARNPVGSIAQIGGLQAIDATNHYAGIAEVTNAQHLTYKPNNYYPKGFHIAVGFIENTVFPSQYSLGWQANVALFFAQYVVMAGMLAYVVYYFAAALSQMIGHKLETFGAHVLTAITLGIPLSLFYLWPMVNEGFLNYYYVITTIIAGLLYLIEIREQQQGSGDDWRKLIQSDALRWSVVAYLLLAYGASVSWPLLIPPLVVTAALFVVSSDLKILGPLRALFSVRGLPIVLAFTLQLIPIYFQLRYASSDGSQGSVDSVGGLKEYHPFILLAGTVLVGILVYGERTRDNFKRLLLSVYGPLAAFVVLLVAYQYFKVAEVRYYAIKSSLLVEILLLVLAVVVLLDAHKRRGLPGRLYAWMLPLVPLVVMVLLVNTTPNPFRDIRELLRPYSREAKPLFFDNDAQAYIKLGEAGKIAHFNSTSLHFNGQQGKFYTHSQLPFWANMMQYDGSKADSDALNCDGNLYSNIAFGSFSDAEQQALVAKVKDCAQMAHERHETYYIVTDKDSLPKLQETFGAIATYVY